MGALTERKRAMPNERKIAELEYQRSEMLRERRDLSIAGAVDRTLHAEIADIERRIAALKGEKPAAQTAKPAAPVAKPVPIAKPTPKVEPVDPVTKDLQDRIDRAANAEIALVGERDSIAYEALVQREDGAIKRLSAINDELQRIAADTAGLRAALAESGRRAEAARAVELATAQRKRAETAKPIAERLAERGVKMDKAMSEYLAEFAGMKADIAELTKLGVPTPSHSIVKINMRNLHDGATYNLDSSSTWVPPDKRRSFASLSQGWAKPALNWITAKLNKSAKAAA
jgi:hypothetical protein